MEKHSKVSAQQAVTQKKPMSVTIQSSELQSTSCIVKPSAKKPVFPPNMSLIEASKISVSADKLL